LNLSKTVAAIKDLVFLATFVIGIFGALTTVIVTFGWPIFIEKLSEDLNVATKNDIEAITQRMDKISGEDRILKMKTGHSFIQEPVTKGQPIGMTLTGNRTERGKDCVFRKGTPLFTDDRDIPFPGKDFGPVKQFDKHQSRIQLTLIAPDTIKAGRVGVYLSMHYACPYGNDGAIVDVFEDTDTFFFQMLP
tara:strand:+ start:2394 stop:2966 length:573 start_codon:yes stop_codon:yes gene_type:complete